MQKIKAAKDSRVKSYLVNEGVGKYIKPSFFLLLKRNFKITLGLALKIMMLFDYQQKPSKC